VDETEVAAPPLCLRCGRALHSERARRAGYGPECWAAILAARNQVDQGAWSPGQVDAALELIRDGGIVLIRDPHSYAFRSVASDGAAFYLTVTAACSCPAGQREILCYHRAAVAILLASRSTSRSCHRDYTKTKGTQE
jgi:hypothetical protein